MAEVSLTQEEAKTLFEMEKHTVKNEAYNFPMKGNLYPFPSFRLMVERISFWTFTVVL